MQAFLILWPWGLLSSCKEQASHCGSFSCCGAQALGSMSTYVVAAPEIVSTGSLAVAHELSWLHGLWDLPESGIEPVSPALSGGFFTTELPEKHPPIIFKLRKILLNLKYFSDINNFVIFMKIFRTRVMRIPRSFCLNT